MVFRIQVLARVTGMRPVIGWPVRWLQSDSVAPLKIREPIKLRGLRLRRVLLLRRPSLECLLPSLPPVYRTTRLRGMLGAVLSAVMPLSICTTKTSVRPLALPQLLVKAIKFPSRLIAALGCAL